MFNSQFWRSRFYTAQFWKTTGVIPPIPTPYIPPSVGGGRYPTVVQFDEKYLENERLRKQRLIEDEEFIIFLS